MESQKYKVLYLGAVLTSLLNDMQFLTFRAHVIRALVLHAVSHPFPCARPCAAEDPVRQTPLPQPVRFSSRVLSPGRCRAHARAFEWNTPTWGSEPRPAPTAPCHAASCSLVVGPLTDLSVRPRTAERHVAFKDCR